MRFRSGRPFRRPGRMRFGPPLFGPLSLLGAALMPLLMEANRLFAAGQYSEAARLFAQLAEQAETNGNLRRAANLHLEGARSWLLANDGQAAVAQARAALQLFQQIGRVGRAAAVYQRVVAELRARGMNAEADALERDFRAQFSDAVPMAGPASGPAPSRGRLPAKCPQCGGPVRSDEVEWIDDHSASACTAAVSSRPGKATRHKVSAAQICRPQ
jgi:predicted DCC family thiol-disulfide oxidoreductase YuxK